MDNTLTKNQIYTSTVASYTSEGQGVCRIEGRAVFVPGVIMGEECEVRIVKVTNGAVYGRCEKVLRPSPERAEPDCPHYKKCGGCSTRHMSYSEELRFKLGRVNDALTHIGKQTVTAGEIIPSPAVLHYRNKSIFAVGSDNGRLCSGFYRQRSHDIIDIESCVIQNEYANLITRFFLGLMEEFKLKPYNEETGKGAIRHIFVRNGINSDDLVVCIISAEGLGKATGPIVKRLTEAFPLITGIVLNVNKTKGNTVLSGDFYTLWGKPEIRDSICGYYYSISPAAFFQINPPQATQLYNKAVEYADLTGKETVLDLYCGAGTISLCLAQKAGKVIGAEIVQSAIDNAKINAQENGVDNVEFICADAADAAEGFREAGIKPDCVCVDPPRKGLDESVIGHIAAMNPERVVYVSCNPSTLARDILLFNDYGYELKAATAFDMFPGTAHVETVCLLSKLNAKQHIEINLDMDELDLTDAEKKATYQEIKDYVLEHSGLKVSSLYIAQVKQQCGIIERENYNKPKSEDAKQPQCPPDKEKAIKEALRHFGMI